MSSAHSRLALPLALFVLAVYVALLPWTGQVWTRTGDEPHYLIAADNLVRHGSFDLQNSYDPAVYLDWYPAPNLEPQVKTRADGAQFLVHTYGLSILIAPAYWLAGARGVAYFMALLGALLAGQVYLLALQVTHNWLASALGALVVAFAPPLVWYVYLLYPELPGALCVTVAARVLVGDLPPRPPSPLRSASRISDPKGKGVPVFPGGSREEMPVVNVSTLSSREPGRTPSFSPLPLRKGGLGGVGPLLLALSLGALPWLSARFIPVALTLAALAVWRAALPITKYQLSITQSFRRLLAHLAPVLASLLLLALSLAGLAWFNASHYDSTGLAASYTLDVNPGPVSTGMLFQFTRGVLGWLLDHQRGLLVAAPIFFVAFIGLGQWLWRRAWAAVVVGLPFAVALASTALIGGFWVGIEPAARYLVFVLPLLGAALAYAWAHRRGPWLAGLAAVTLAASLWTAGQVFKEPLLAQTRDLIGEQLPGLVPFLPALGKPKLLWPGAPGEVSVPLPETPGLWRVPKGQAGAALQQPAIVDLPFGWYTLQFNLGTRGAPAEAPVARVLFQSGDNVALVDTMLYGRDFSPDGQLRPVRFAVFNNISNQWEQPAGLWIFTTGQADLTLSGISLSPDPFHSLILPSLWLAGLVLLGLLVGSRFAFEPALPGLPGWLSGWAPVAAGAVLVLAVGAWSLRPLPRQYSVFELANLIGSRVPEPATAVGAAISTAGDEDTPGVLAQTGLDFWPAGHYRWRLSLKAAGPAATGAAFATVSIQASRRPISGFPAQVAAAAVPADGRFHTLEVQFDNPIHQALQFELDATGAGPFESQGFEVSPAP